MPSSFRAVQPVKAPAQVLGRFILPALFRPHLLPSSPPGSPSLGSRREEARCHQPSRTTPCVLASPEPCPRPTPFKESLRQTFPKDLHPCLTLIRGSAHGGCSGHGRGINERAVASVISGLLPTTVSQGAGRLWPVPPAPNDRHPHLRSLGAGPQKRLRPRTAPPSCPEFAGPLQMQVSSAPRERKQSVF